MNTYLKFLSTISLLDVLKYSLLNLLFFAAMSTLIIHPIFYYIMNYQIHFIKTGDFVTLIALFSGLYLLTCITFFLLHKQQTKRKLPLLVLNLLVLRFSIVNEVIIDFISNSTLFGLFFWIAFMLFIGIIYLTRFHSESLPTNRTEMS